jgi:uncharacterized protein (DUF2252 family)
MRKEGRMPKPVEHPTIDERAAKGKAARATVPRAANAEWDPSRRVHRPLELLAEQDETRAPDLVPIRYGRMAASPFAYYRGAALPMAADLATMSHSHLTVQLCGDAHLSNFGGFASPEREMLFDVNDFDETLPGPFEWDVKRLAASLEVAARGRACDRVTARNIVRAAVRSYRLAIQEFASMTNLAVWYARLDVPEVINRWGGTASKKVTAEFERDLAKAQTRDQLKARAHLTHMVDGELRFHSDPPLLVPVRELLANAEAEALDATVRESLRQYRRTLPGDRRHLLERYRYADLARKVVGVGSVGTQAWVALFVGRNIDDTLILQVKEAEASVLERFLIKSAFRNHGQRVAEGQRLMQAASDIFLGWQRVSEGLGGKSQDYYMRQLWDWKFSANIDTMTPQLLSSYAEMCGWTLARAHARSGDAIAIASYLGTRDSFDQAVADFAFTYADQNEADHHTLVDAISTGKIQAETGI